MKNIVVIGSLNIDQIVTTARLPKLGETIEGINFTSLIGGKGCNQSVHIARCGTSTTHIGCVGDDSHGEILIQHLQDEKVVSSITKIKNKPTGIAQITNCNGENQIIVIPGANSDLTYELVEKYKEQILNADFVLMQFEIPLDTIEKTVDFCFENNIKLALNPAPIKAVSETLIAKSTYIIPNEIEALSIFGVSPEEAVKKYPNKLIITRGKKGAIFNDGHSNIIVRPNPTKVVDTTGAGDSFIGCFLSNIVEGKNVEESIKLANDYAGKVIGIIGAQ